MLFFLSDPKKRPNAAKLLTHPFLSAHQKPHQKKCAQPQSQQLSLASQSGLSFVVLPPPPGSTPAFSPALSVAPPPSPALSLPSVSVTTTSAKIPRHQTSKGSSPIIVMTPEPPDGQGVESEKKTVIFKVHPIKKGESAPSISVPYSVVNGGPTGDTN